MGCRGNWCGRNPTVFLLTHLLIFQHSPEQIRGVRVESMSYRSHTISASPPTSKAIPTIFVTVSARTASPKAPNWS